jgi:hypothetical protein
MLCIQNQHAEKNAQGKALRILRKSMNTLAQTWIVFILHNLVPTKHTSDVRMVYCHLIYCLIKKIWINGAQVILYEMHSFVTKKAVADASLGFLALITAMCMRARVPNVNPTQPIETPMDKAYIKNHCIETQTQAPPPQPQQPSQSTPPTTADQLNLIQFQLNHLFL